MAIFKKGKPPPASASVATDVVEQNIQVVEATTSTKDDVSSSSEKNEKIEGKDKKEKKPQASLGNYFRVLSYGTPLDWALMVASMLTSIGAGIAMPLMNVVFGNLVGDFTGYFIPGSSVTKHQFQSAVNKNALYITYLFIGKFALSYISMLCVRLSGLRISAALRLAYLRALFHQPVSVIDTISPGKVSTRITTSSNTIQLAISQHFAMAIQALAFTLGLYIVAFVKNWLLTFVASISLPFILIVYGSLVPPFITIHKITENYHEEASALAFEMFSSIRIIVAFGAEAKLARQHAALLDKAAKNGRRTAPLMGLMMSPSMMAMYGTFGLTFWFGIRQYTRGHIHDIGVIIVVLFSVMMAVMSIGRLASPIIAIAKAASAATELFITIDANVPDTSGLKDPDISADADVFFKNVAFSYPSRPNVQILSGLDLRFSAGKVTAIVGPSGSGKSTVVALLQRWYDLLGTIAVEPTTDKMEDTTSKKEVSKKKKVSTKPGQKDDEEELSPNTCTGAIEIGDNDLRSVDLKWWRSQIGLVQQEPFLFNDTLFNNVAHGLCGTQFQDITNEEKMQMVEDACKEAYADEFIAQLPQGYNTLVGESGIKLSGGQRQRIAIARSIIKKPRILILDEATSAIDVRTERIVQEALDRVSKNRTTIVIAHRLSTIKRADKIVVLRHGKLVEEGSHEELLEDENGVYYGLVHAQELAMEAEEEEEEEVALQKTKTAITEHSEPGHGKGKKATSMEDPTYKEQGLLMSFGRLIFEQRHHWLLYIIAVLGVFGAGAVYPLQAFIFANIVEVFTFTGQKFVDRGNFWSGMFGVEAAGVGVSYFVLGFSSHLISVAITRTYRQEYLINMMRKRIPFFDDEGHSAGSLTSRLSADTEQLQQLMSTEMSLALIACVNLLGSTIIAFVYGWKLSLVGLFCALPPILAAGYLRFRLEMQFEQMNAAVFKDSSQFATEAVGAFRTVLSLIMEDMIGDRYQTLLRGHVKQAFSSAKFGTIVFAASDSVELACTALAFWYGGTLLASHEYGLQDFFVIYMAVVQGAVAAGMWFSFAPNMAQATGAANRILSMRTPSTTLPPSYNPINDPTSAVSISFQNVYFSYKSREVPVLSNLNLHIPAGKFAALVGASGCGKSTTISLLERFYDVDSGMILYNGQDITSLDPKEYRAQIALVSQEPTLYEGSIRDNVSLSVDEGKVTDEDIECACINAQIHEFITSLPEGYNTRLGPKGMSLSGGQKQRLSLARALLRKPRLLLLDEATSSLDSESEKLVQKAIERAAEGRDGNGDGDGQGRTVIAVAHRLATIQKADVIFVLGSGKVLEEGDHQTLLRKRGVYWQMCQAQALDR
ncbi:P-loop containing nucleoside triphosphate hydrolase protein [Lindgomyces ingoldianus]|uniref:P-loop containing nucleoside triphosphate hydrolase protein n=1 Tax=Lindgomyces ingoldianus TaxID=673940 RepID=A0ACB6R0T5_9PLEO|nr:P-loop containing nucleoside triphosphate hydrolase protein [Lindgomyces ingoldianus]KAF2472924.1 P-loop containing nucleoside triphosphate hydrolase protein [Lindgomyces ingoldianus]